MRQKQIDANANNNLKENDDTEKYENDYKYSMLYLSRLSFIVNLDKFRISTSI